MTTAVTFLSLFIYLRHPRDFTSHTSQRGTLYIYGWLAGVQGARQTLHVFLNVFGVDLAENVNVAIGEKQCPPSCQCFGRCAPFCQMLKNDFANPSWRIRQGHRGGRQNERKMTQMMNHEPHQEVNDKQ